MKVAIIDDEQSGIDVISWLIKENFSKDLEICGTGRNIIEAEKIILENNDLDLLFLDIEMPGGSGFLLLDKINSRDSNINFKIVFTTAYSQYAIDAFKYSAFDYLLKPIDQKNFCLTVRKLLKEDKQSNSYDNLKSVLNQLRTPNRLKIISRESIDFIDYDDIIYCKSEGNYTRFHLRDNTSLLSSRTLKLFQDDLEANGFLRIHKSHIIKINQIVKYIYSKHGSVIMSNGSELPISKGKSKELLDRFDG